MYTSSALWTPKCWDQLLGNGPYKLGLHFEIADNIISAINDGICIFYSGLKHVHEQLRIAYVDVGSSQDYRIHLVERTQCVFQRSSHPSIAKSPESNPLNGFIRKMPAQISLVSE
ncbi:hypothetical protein OIU77_023414 [Salix suchowensis]|uniref:Uncharacterized protein n=1 Tax=Salix suchowensis TaxID=1278906 RepID=A0ABQ9C723_9ROSI|nr:hypothetical protein OIU77_023414 [Salix suchowensis]